MSKANVLIMVDGREVVARRERLTGLSVLAAVGAHPDRSDVLIREYGGAARIVPPDDLVATADPMMASFRVHRGVRLRH